MAKGNLIRLNPLNDHLLKIMGDGYAYTINQLVNKLKSDYEFEAHWNTVSSYLEKLKEEKKVLKISMAESKYNKCVWKLQK